MSRAADVRSAVLRALAGGQLSESALRRLTGVRGVYLYHALVGLMHEGAVRYVGPVCDTQARKSFVWEAVPNTRPLVHVLPDGGTDHD